MNHSNKDERPLAENEEGRPSIKENAGQPHTYPTQSGDRVSLGLAGVRKAAREHKEMRFTALLHHLTIDLLRESFYSLKKKAAPAARALVAFCSPPQPDAPDTLDTNARLGNALAPSTACAPSLSRCPLRRYSSEIRTGCAKECPSGSVRGYHASGNPYRDLQSAARKIGSQAASPGRHGVS
jgi:hypothetical protein